MSRHPLNAVKRQPSTCIWEITRACNLRCVHCENFGGEKAGNELSFDELLRAADDLAALGGRHVDITGGEPLLHPNWDRFAAALKERGFRCALVTNGTLLDDERLDRAISAGIEITAVSLDGPQKIHDRIRRGPGALFRRGSPFEKTVDAVRRALPRCTVKVITAVNALNLPYLGETYALLSELGVRDWQIQLTVPVGRAVESKTPLVLPPSALNEVTSFIADAQRDGGEPHIDTSDNIGYYTERERFLRKRRSGQGVWVGCHAGVRTVAITYEGKVRGCSILPPEFDAGDLHAERLRDIWADSARFGYSTAFDATKLTGDCARCRFGALCRAGCTATAYYSTGTVYNNPYCIYRGGASAGEAASSRACASVTRNR